MLRSTDLKLVDVTFERMRFDRTFRIEQRSPQRAWFYMVRSGSAWFRAQGSSPVLVGPGEAIGVEGHRHQWSDASHVHPSDRSRSQISALPVEIFMSSMDRSTAVLQRLPQGSILIPAGAHPHSGVLTQAVAMLEFALDEVAGHSSITRRLAEIIMLQIVAYARQELLKSNPELGLLRHDEYLLRAMTAFLAEIGGHWTLNRLADAAGLSRAALVERFRKTFDDSPMAMLNRLRLIRAKEILPDTSASVATIAEQVGFGSSAAFVRAFKRQYGLTPGRFRIDAQIASTARPSC